MPDGGAKACKRRLRIAIARELACQQMFAGRGLEAINRKLQRLQSFVVPERSAGSFASSGGSRWGAGETEFARRRLGEGGALAVIARELVGDPDFPGRERSLEAIRKMLSRLGKRGAADEDDESPPGAQLV
jgi:hypothetical protein